MTALATTELAWIEYRIGRDGKNYPVLRRVPAILLGEPSEDGVEIPCPELERLALVAPESGERVLVSGGEFRHLGSVVASGGVRYWALRRVVAP